MATELTPEEQAFFATGELSPTLAEEHANSQIIETIPPVIEQPPQLPASPAPVNEVAEMLQQSLATEQQRYAEAKTRLDALEKQLQEKLTSQTQAPDPETDPLGAMMHQLNQVNKNVEELQTKLVQEQQNNLLKQQFEQFTSSVRDIKNAYAKTVPDFDDAYSHIRNVRIEDLRAVGVSEADIPKVLLQDELNISQNAIQHGKNPAEEIYKMAKRYGYAAKAAALSPEQKLVNISKGQSAARQPARAAPENELTIEGLKDAGDNDLNNMVQDEKLWAKLVGNRTDDIF
jgi:DNA repair exonuclease SbcCD ATPase subunit